MDTEIPAGERRRRRLKKWWRLSAVVLLLVLVALWGVDFSRASVKLSNLQIGEADIGSIVTTVNASGRVKPGLEEIITSPINSRIIRVYKRAGDLVEEGEPILQLDLLSVQTQYKQMLDEKRMKEYQLNQKRINIESSLREQQMRVEVKEKSVDMLAMELRNEQYLDSIGSGTGDNVRRARFALETARLELEQMRQALVDAREVKQAELRVNELDMEIFNSKVADVERTLADARILAPRRAVLTQISSEIGRQVSAGSQVAVLSELDHYKLECEIADSYGDRVDIGSEVVIKIGKNLIEGVISDMSPVSQSGVLSFTVQPVDDSDPCMRSGQRADIYVKTNVLDDVVRVPNGTFYSAGPGAYRLFVVSADGSEVCRRDVTLGQSNYDFVEVVSGINPGERLVISDMTPYKTKTKLKLSN